MAVKLRQKLNNDGTITPYLDIYHNKKRQYEFLPMLRLDKEPAPNDRSQAAVTIRSRNRERWKQAEEIGIKRSAALQASDYDMTTQFKRHVDFVEFFDNFVKKYKKRDLRLVDATFKKFKSFMADAGIKSLTAKQITPKVVHEFKNYLSENLTGESPANYFKKFKLAIKQAIREDIILKDPCDGQSIKIKSGIKKQVLSPEEIQMLANTPMRNPQVKRACILSLYTGLRFSDVQAIRWRDIDFHNNRINFQQQKTGERVDMTLHKTALKMLGEPGKPNELVFTLPTHTAVSKSIQIWVDRAGINKKITFHCFRHSFATNIIFFGADVNTASKLLGHTSFRYTERYVHIVNSLKENAVNNLPEV